METGVITHENLPTLLRSISQRRRQGVLEVHFPEYQVHLLFVQGRVVEAHTLGTPGPAETLARIREAGFLTSDAGTQASSYAQLTQLLAAHSQIDSVSLKRIIKHRILNHLYSLDSAASSFYSFKVQMVEFERDFSPNISVGQVLLDLVALDAEHQQFIEFFPESCIISCGDEESPALSEEESIIYELIGPTGRSVTALEQQALLSRYHFENSLLSMLTRSIIRVNDGGAVLSDTPGLGTEALLQALDRSIDDSFETETMLSSTSTLAGAAPRGARPSVSEGALDSSSELIGGEAVFEPPRFRIGTWCALHSMKLLQSEWTINVAAIIFIAACVYIPWTLWGRFWTAF